MDQLFQTTQINVIGFMQVSKFNWFVYQKKSVHQFQQKLIKYLAFLSLILICTFAFRMDIKVHAKKAQTQNSLQKSTSSNLPEGFVYVDEIDPTIVNNLRYFTTQNFIDEVLIGYYANRAIMTREAAIALKNANTEFAKDGYKIVIYDSYRPQKTVQRFVEWSIDVKPDTEAAKYSPYIDKSQLFDLGYISKKSGHTRGSTVDMSIIKIGTQLKPVQLKLRELQDGRLIFYLDDNTEDMFSSFDLGDQSSHVYNNTLIPKEYTRRRMYLVDIMQKNGFTVLDEEWWHFKLNNEPFPNTYFDFDIV